MYDVLNAILYALVLALVAVTIWLIKTRIGVEWMRKVNDELMAKQELAAMAVKWAQQSYWSQSGMLRYRQAATWLATECARRGIEITEDQIKILIESTLRNIKDEFGEEWAKALEDTTTGITV